MEYITNDFCANLGFRVTTAEVLKAANELNSFLSTLPPHLFRSLDFKTTGAMVGAIFCAQLAQNIEGAMVNPIEKGYPDIIPLSGKNATEEQLRNYPHGLEVKGTIGNLRTGISLKGGQQRIDDLSTITWQAHHREVNKVLCIVWDFCNEKNGFMYPALTAAFYTDELKVSDWGEISGTTGRNTKVTGIRESGKRKLGKGLVLMYKSEKYIKKYSKIMKIEQTSPTLF